MTIHTLSVDNRETIISILLCLSSRILIFPGTSIINPRILYCFLSANNYFFISDPRILFFFQFCPRILWLFSISSANSYFFLFFCLAACFSSFSRAFCSFSFCFFSRSIAVLRSLTFFLSRSLSLATTTPSCCKKSEKKLCKLYVKLYLFQN